MHCQYYNYRYGEDLNYKDNTADDVPMTVLCYDCRYELSADGHASGDQGCLERPESMETRRCHIPQESCMVRVVARKIVFIIYQNNVFSQFTIWVPF